MKIRTLLSVIAGALAAMLPNERVAAQISIVGGSILETQASPGSEYEGGLVVRNDAAKPQHVRVYLTDYSFTANGTSNFGDAGSSPRSNARWISLAAQTAVIAPGQSAAIRYRVSVPALSPGVAGGSYWSMAMIEAEELPAGVSGRTRGVSVRTVIRPGVQIVTHVGTTASASIGFSNVQVSRGATGTELRFDARNDGSRARRLTLSVDLYTAAGAFVGRFSKSRGLVYPGASIRQAFVLGSISKGDYLAFIVADAGDDDLFAGNFRLEL